MKANKNLNHTTAHLLAAAVLKLYPDTILGFGPPIDEGFYYDFEFTNPINEEDLKKIEKEMKKISSGGHTIESVEKYDMSKQPLKNELYNELLSKNMDITYYGMINPSDKKSVFTDLCKGGHIESISKIKNFKLLSLAGAYWRGDSKNQQLTRIYGTSWETKEQLDEYLNILKERKERDHRKIGKEINIFTIDELSGQGFPIFLEGGMIVKNEIKNFLRDLEWKYEFTEVQTPAFGSVDLYKISGHLDHYGDDMYPIMEVDNEKLLMRPMTCPHHLIIYKKSRKSYRDLPIRYSEHARLYRYEKSGALIGLERVRSMELTDAHILATKGQLEEEFTRCYNLIMETLGTFNIEIDYISLSLRDPEDKEKYFDDNEMWDEVESLLKNVLEKLNVEYKEVIGEAAFYGPKMDIQVKTALNHEITLSTIQLDFLLPKRFNIEYIDSDGTNSTPVLIHRGLIGTYERFISILLEQTKGNLPLWLAPIQVVVIPINNEVHEQYSQEIYKLLRNEKIRVKIDNSDLRLNKKVRNAQISKAKFQLIIGDNEIENKTINMRRYGSQDQEEMSTEKFINLLKKEIENKE